MKIGTTFRGAVAVLSIIGLLAGGTPTWQAGAALAPDRPDLTGFAVSTNEVDLSWTPVTAPPISGYTIRRNNNVLATVVTSTLAYTDTAVSPRAVYVYTVEAIATDGGHLPRSRPAVIKTPPLPDTPDSTPPSAPEDLFAVPVAGGVLLDWYYAIDDTDVTAYVILRNGRRIKLVDSATYSYVDSNVQPGQTYTYAIAAFDTVHHLSAPSESVVVQVPPGSAAGTNAPPANVPNAPLAAAEVATAGYSTHLQRYPYLTDVVNNYATVNWATDNSGSTGSVTWGQVGSEACTAHSVTATKTNMTVNGVSEYQWKANLTLSANTQYCYRVFQGSTDLLGSDAAPRFWTQVPAGSNQSYSFAVLGDWGNVDSTGAAPEQANLMSQIAASGARFALTTGDNAYSSGSQTNYGDLTQTGASISAVFGPAFWTVAGATIPLFPATGNHGLSRSDTNHPHFQNWPQDRAVSTSNGRYVKDPYCCVNGSAAASYPSAWYAFDAGTARFYVLTAAWADSNTGTGSVYANDYAAHWTTSNPEYQWLENDLATHPTGLKFAVFHYPLYSDNASETSDTFLQGATSLEGLLSRYGVDIAFNGHAHIYERNRKAGSNSLISYVTGGGGAKLEPVSHCSAVDAYSIGWSYSATGGAGGGSACGGASRPTSLRQVFHFLLVTVNGTQVTVAPTDSQGHIFDVQTYSFN
jgi:hypothetical protein